MAAATKIRPTPPPPPARNRSAKWVPIVLAALLALAVAGFVGYLIGKPTDRSVHVVQSGTGTIDMVNIHGTAGCVKTDSNRLCSVFAISGGHPVKVGDKVGYAHEWADVTTGSEDLLMIYPLNG